MDIRTEVQLCLSDLVPLIEAGDFRKFGEAEKLIMDFAASASNERHRGALLSKLAEKLSDIGVPINVETDAIMRATKALVRQQMKKSFSAAFAEIS